MFKVSLSHGEQMEKEEKPAEFESEANAKENTSGERRAGGMVVGSCHETVFHCEPDFVYQKACGN